MADMCLDWNLWDDDAGLYKEGPDYVCTSRGPQPKICNRCGRRDLYWGLTPNGWRLHARTGVTYTIHTCDFNDIIKYKKIPNFVAQANRYPHYLRWAKAINTQCTTSR